MKEAKGKQTKGKQKIEMKKVEAYGDRMITFSKRKFGIYKKMNEIVALCDVEAVFLVFSQAGKPYSFANPSMEEVVGRLMNPSNPESSAKDDNSNTRPLVEAYKKKQIESLMKKYMELLEELDMENEKAKLCKESRNEKEIDKMWWNFTSEDLSVEKLEQRHQPFFELRDRLCDMRLSRLGKDGDGSFSGSEGRHCGGGEA